MFEQIIERAPAPLECKSCHARESFGEIPAYMGGPCLEDVHGAPIGIAVAQAMQAVGQPVYELRWHDWRCQLCGHVTPTYYRLLREEHAA